jgi:hypothetical protein
MTTRERMTQMLGAIAVPVASSVASLPAKFNEWLGTLPTTQLRFLATIVSMEITTLRYVWSSDAKPWEPSMEWLAFLLAMAGVDTVQFFAKRKTHKPNGAGPDLPPPPGASL